MDITQDKTARYFLITLSMIVMIGMVMVYSSSYIFAKESVGNAYHFIIRQAAFLFLGILCALVLSFSKFNFWKKRCLPIHIFFTFFLLLTLIPGIGIKLKGSSRWLNIAGFNLQPGEIIKYSIILPTYIFCENFFSYSWQKKVIQGAGIFLPLLIFLLQPDFGSFSICSLVMLFVCFMSSFPRKFFYGVLLGGLGSMIGLLFLAPYRVQRFLSFLDPWKDPRNKGFQLIQSFLAFANGSFWGKGIGNSNEKLFYLPEAYNDFIFSVIGEELGFFGVSIIIVLFLSLIYLGLKMSSRTEERDPSIFIAVVIFTIGIQTLINMCVVLGLLPTKGLNLPFISYGGSSLLANFIAIGLIFSARRSAVKK